MELQQTANKDKSTSAFLEEAKQMAIDYDVLCKDFFPANQLARLLMKPIKDNPREAGRKLNAVQDARSIFT